MYLILKEIENKIKDKPDDRLLKTEETGIKKRRLLKEEKVP